MAAKVRILPEEREDLEAVGEVTGVERIQRPAYHPNQFQGRKPAAVVSTGHDKRTPAQLGRLAQRSVKPVVLRAAASTPVDQNEEDDVPPAVFMGRGG